MTIKAVMGDINAINSAGTLAALISHLRMPSGVYDPVGKRLLVNSVWIPWFEPVLEESHWYEIDGLGCIGEIIPELSGEILEAGGYHSRTKEHNGIEKVLLGWKLTVGSQDYIRLVVMDNDVSSGIGSLISPQPVLIFERDGDLRCANNAAELGRSKERRVGIGGRRERSRYS